MKDERKYWTESAAEWEERARHYATVAAFYEARGPQYAAPVEEAQENVAWAHEKAANARAQLAKLENAE